jgi:hypothetical protein
MSSLFRSPPSAFIKHNVFELFEANNTTSVDSARQGPELKQDCKGSAPPVLLRDDHIVLLAIDALLGLHASFKKWRNHQRTLRALAELDERQLRDIGLTRDGASFKTPL